VLTVGVHAAIACPGTARRSFVAMLACGGRARAAVSGSPVDPRTADELGLTSLKYGGSSRRAPHDADWEATLARSGSQPPPDTLAAARAMATADGPELVEVAGVGAFWREQRPAMTLFAASPVDAAGWLDRLPEPPPPPVERELRAPAGARYVKRFR